MDDIKTIFGSQNTMFRETRQFPRRDFNLAIIRQIMLFAMSFTIH